MDLADRRPHSQVISCVQTVHVWATPPQFGTLPQALFTYFSAAPFPF